MKSRRPYIGNTLPEKVKAESSQEHFRNFTNTWFGLRCNWGLFLFLEKDKIVKIET